MNLASDTADAIRELRRIWHDPAGTVAAWYNRPTILIISFNLWLLQYIDLTTYVDVDILVSSIFQAQRHKLIGRCQNFRFIDVFVKIQIWKKIDQP